LGVAGTCEAPDGLLGGSLSQPSELNDAQRQVVARMSESGPIPAVHSAALCQLTGLAHRIFEEFRPRSDQRDSV
jgi:hypothetical protein